MKGLARKLIAPVLIGGASLLPLSSHAQKTQEKFVPHTYWAGEAMLYADDDSNIQDRYKPILGGGGRMFRDINPNFRWELAAGIYSGKGDFRVGDTNANGSLTMVFFEGITRYQQEDGFFFGAGPILLNARERVSIPGFVGSDSGSGLGGVVGAGIDFGSGNSKFSIRFDYISMFTGPELSGGRLSIGFKNRLKSN
ncbi:MAG: hypothetical protein KJ879_01295 [Nanoarchaeota archaeon]|nr:hypothetical protein [Nanoarchaeota archaeon]